MIGALGWAKDRNQLSSLCLNIVHPTTSTARLNTAQATFVSTSCITITALSFYSATSASPNGFVCSTEEGSEQSPYTRSESSGKGHVRTAECLEGTEQPPRAKSRRRKWDPSTSTWRTQARDGSASECWSETDARQRRDDSPTRASPVQPFASPTNTFCSFRWQLSPAHIARLQRFHRWLHTVVNCCH